MGGPCYVKDGKAEVKGPPATDNFQIIPFTYGGVEWHSVEQCFQAQKFERHMPAWKAIHDAVPKELEAPKSYGNRIWSLGRSFSEIRPDWENVKVEIMYLVCCAKYACHDDLRVELLATGENRLEGGPSTWEWTKWNGFIQMLIRKKLRDGVDLSTITRVTAEEFLEFES
jgi:ribA/ribD-fused uncharacterized protein